MDKASFGAPGSKSFCQRELPNIAKCSILFMHVISKKAIVSFWRVHPAARSPLESWYRVVSKSRFENFSDIRQAFGSADYVAPYTIFDIGGNNFRVITVIHYNRQKLFIREVLTHAEYDRWSKEYGS
ncbi:type II toxin-antitoxin system HigB family toxin [Desulforhabdus sp. TSK]|uniref:type II toxin-antitoxin system HigB family toxin n=1 Tax=Desulforhabdus sp. TSK TaxID=2925014 RepID=UPI001FC8D1AA|nr:type II toxin-antitoxin system HigB family toxin [Desulforhabdus sp. TSK]GKT10950.1 hypothetical protein DSTSK_42550 [Desulforhabdus sp. TSK]